MSRNTMKCASLLTALSIAVAQAQMPAAAPASAAAPAPPPAPPRARGPSLALAVEAAQAVAATCSTNGYKVTVLVVDSAGVPVVMLSGDGAGERTQSIAPTKIAAAIRYNMSSGEVLEKTKTDAALAAEVKADPKIGNLRQGALLLKVGNDTIGAMAASGAPGGDKDELCVKAGIDKIKDRLR
jgi:uncharacterized protein GlcG (DUF336 family)